MERPYLSKLCKAKSNFYTMIAGSKQAPHKGQTAKMENTSGSYMCYVSPSSRNKRSLVLQLYVCQHAVEETAPMDKSTTSSTIITRHQWIILKTKERSQQAQALKLIYTEYIYAIWKERNTRIIEKHETTVEVITRRIACVCCVKANVAAKLFLDNCSFQSLLVLLVAANWFY